MPTEAVGIDFEQVGLPFLADVIHRFFCGFVDLHHIHAVNGGILHTVPFGFLANFITAEARSTEVPMPYWLFSQTHSTRASPSLGKVQRS